MVRAGSLNAVKTPTGAIRIIEQVFGEYQVRTISGGSPRFNDYVEKKWYPDMSDADIARAVRAYNGPKP